MFSLCSQSAYYKIAVLPGSNSRHQQGRCKTGFRQTQIRASWVLPPHTSPALKRLLSLHLFSLAAIPRFLLYPSTRVCRLICQALTGWPVCVWARWPPVERGSPPPHHTISLRHSPSLFLAHKEGPGHEKAKHSCTPGNRAEVQVPKAGLLLGQLKATWRLLVT